MKKQISVEEKVYSYIQKHHMLEKDDKVIIGVSGGADSVCLLFVLLEYAGKVPLSLAVVHVNHGIRQDAAQDAQYVEKLCRSRGLPFYLVNADARKEAAICRCSEEEAGRLIRYRAFEEAAADFGADKIAVAHNSNDRAETMLFHLFRGSDLRGMGSIRPVRDNIIRPMLCLEREEIESYLKERGISYCQDSTNEEDTYTRNRIRHHIFPYVEQEIVRGCVSHMGQTAEMFAETEDYLEQQTRAALKECTSGEKYAIDSDLHQNVWAVEIGEFVKFPLLIQKRMAYSVITALAGSRKDISHIHVEEILELVNREGNRRIYLPYGLVAERCYGQLFFRKKFLKEKKEPSGFRLEEEWEPVYRKGTCHELLGCSAKEAIESGKLQEVTQNEYTKQFDCDKIKQSLEFRTRRVGDYFTLKGKEGKLIHKSVKDYMIEKKIPRNERDKIPLLTEGSHVLWMAGYRISEYYKISEHTKQVLQVQLNKKRYHSESTEEENG